jgi:NADH-quinone oxidoreductase subunit C
MAEDSFDKTKRKDQRIGSYSPKHVPVDDVMVEVLSKIDWSERIERKGNRAEIKVPPDNVPEVLNIFRKRGYDHFVALTCIDLIREDMFELVYHLWSYGSRIHVYVKTSIRRNDPSIRSVVDVFRPAITYEREIKEMFGVDFPGNPRLTQFILEDWDGPPPMLKDFDSIQFVQDVYDMKVRNPKGLPPKWTKEEDV